MKNKVLVPVLVLLIGLGAGFGGGYFYRGYQLRRMRSNFTFGNGQGGNFQRFNGRNGGPGGFRGGAVMGTILSIDDKSITVKLPDGSSKIVLFSDSTTYSDTTKADKTSLKVGSEVAVFGAPNTDGSVTASSVQLNPMFTRLMGTPLPSAQ